MHAMSEEEITSAVPISSWMRTCVFALFSCRELSLCTWFGGLRWVWGGGGGVRKWVHCSKSIPSSGDLRRNKTPLCRAETWEPPCSPACFTHQHWSWYMWPFEREHPWWLLLLLNTIVFIMAIYIWLHSTPVCLTGILGLWCHLTSTGHRPCLASRSRFLPCLVSLLDTLCENQGGSLSLLCKGQSGFCERWGGGGR